MCVGDSTRGVISDLFEITSTVTVAPSMISLKSMLPPKRPESPVGAGAEPNPGATATQPSIGRTGTVKLFRCSVGFSGMARPR
jgi:hypothetical protein